MLRRVDDPWDAWDEAIAAGATPPDILRTLTDETLVEMASFADPQRRRYESDLVLSEIKNRFARLRRQLVEATGIADALLASVARGTEEGVRLLAAQSAAVPQEAVDEAMRIVEAATREAQKARERLAAIREAGLATARHKEV